MFPYLPASALFLWPLAQLPLALTFWLWAIAMLASALLAARIAVRVFGLSVPAALGSTLAWAPVTGAIVIGQNTPFGLLLAMLAMEGLTAGHSSRALGVDGRPSGAGSTGSGAGSTGSGAGRAGVGPRSGDGVRAGARRAGAFGGLLLYKPTLGLPLVGLMVLRGRWRALAVVAVVAAGWYIGGVAASGGNAGWPRTWLDTILGYVGQDAAVNADKAVSVPGLIARLPIPTMLVVAASVAIVALAIPRLMAAPIAEAAAGACLIGVAASPHAWGYDAVFVLPIIWWALAGGIMEPWRTRLIAAAYVLAPFWLISRQTQLSRLCRD